MTQFFLNELSIEGQFASSDEFATALSVLNGVLGRIADTTFEKKAFIDPTFYTRQPTANSVFSSCLEQVPDKSARLLFKRLTRDRLNCSNWREEIFHDIDSYYIWEGELVSDTSVGELSERCIQGHNGLLVNFAHSRFPSGHAIKILKEPAQEVSLEAACDVGGLNEFWRKHPELGVTTYDPGCGRKPTDDETILKDRARFHKTKLLNHGRAVYLERSTGLYFCVDNMHRYGAHLEVFDAQGKHYGEADLAGEVDRSKIDTTKVLVL
jgi:hypothetical protein